jgi:hypothetical protein
MPAPDVHDLMTLMQMEFSEMPDLSLTLWQAERLWSAPREICEEALGRLVKAGFLGQLRDGRFVRRGAPRARDIHSFASSAV